MSLLEQVLTPRNMATAQKRVIANKGAAGVDGMKVGELNAFMAENRTSIIESIENGTYQPQAVLWIFRSILTPPLRNKKSIIF